MSITDELRAWAKGSTLSSWTAEHLTAIADHIDAEHKKACDDAWDNGYEADYLGIEKWLTEHPQAMEHHGWVRLPMDADGVPIRVGDVMEGEKIGGGYGEPFEVVGYITINGELEPMDEHKLPRKRKYLRHHHEPTVEDVLRDYASRILMAGCIDEEDELVDKYAAKLRLAEEVDA